MSTSGSAVNDLARICAVSTDVKEWEDFLRLTSPFVALTIARACRIWTGSAPPSLVDDITQELYLKLCEQDRKVLREFQPRGKDSFFALLRTVSASVANDYFRRHYSVKRGGKVVTTSLDEKSEMVAVPRANQSTYQSVLHQELDQIMRAAPEVVSERDRTLFWLYYVHGFTAEELASMDGTQLSPKGVESALRRVSTWLRREIEKRRRGVLFETSGQETTG